MIINVRHFVNVKIVILRNFILLVLDPSFIHEISFSSEPFSEFCYIINFALLAMQSECILVIIQ